MTHRKDTQKCPPLPLALLLHHRQRRKDKDVLPPLTMVEKEIYEATKIQRQKGKDACREDNVSLTEETRCLVSGEGVTPLLLSLGHDLLRFLLMLDGIGRYEVGSVRLSCKALLEVVGLRHDEQVGVLLAFDGGWGGGLQTDFELEAHRPAPARS